MSDEANKANADPAKQPDGTANSIVDTVKSGLETAKASVEGVLPSADAVKPSDETTKPVVQAAQNGAETVKSTVEAALPSTGAAKPGQGTAETPSSSNKQGIHNLRTQNEYDEAMTDKDSLIVIDFLATWCGPCKVIAPQVVKFAKKYPDVRFFNLDVDDLPALSKELNIRAMPTFVLYKGGKKVAVVVGANPKALEAAIKANLDGEDQAMTDVKPATPAAAQPTPNINSAAEAKSPPESKATPMSTTEDDDDDMISKLAEEMDRRSAAQGVNSHN